MKQKIIKVLLVVLVAYILWSLTFTWSRGAWVATIIGIVYIGTIKYRKILIALVVFLIIWKTIMPLSVIERIEMTKNEEGALGSTATGRIQMWDYGIALFMKNPIGYGFNTIRLLGFRGHNRWEIDSGKIGRGDTHNRYVEFLVEMGIIGIAIFLYLYYIAFRSGWDLFKNADDDLFKGLGLGFSACVISNMVANLFGDRWTYLPLMGHYWAFWALAVNARLVVIREKKLNLDLK